MRKVSEYRRSATAGTLCSHAERATPPSTYAGVAVVLTWAEVRVAAGATVNTDDALIVLQERQ